jgi:phasin family protein
MGAAMKSNAAARQGIEDAMRSMGGMMQEQMTRAATACAGMMAAKSPQEAADMQAEFVKGCVDSMVAGSGKISEISMRTAQSAMDPLAQQTNEAVAAMMKKAKAA